MSEPITREEMYFAALGGEAVTLPDPLTREELYLAYLNGMTDTYPEPITRTEQYLYKLCQNGMGGGGGVTIRNQNKTITENGSYRADSGYTGLGTVTVNVPQEEPVLQNKTVTENGTVTADAGFDGLGVVTVNVEASGGGADVARAIVERTITEYDGTGISNIGKYAFSNCESLKTVIFPDANTVGAKAFENCKSLEAVDFPSAKTVDTAFLYCTSLKTVRLPSCEGALTGFSGCTALTELHIPLVNNLGTNALLDCSSVKSLTLPSVATLYSSMPNMTSLEKVDLHSKVSFIRDGCFKNCPNMKTLILRSNEICSMGTAKVFDYSPFASGGTGGTVYCPASLITQYQQATNWATLYAAGTCNFVAIEGSEYE